MHRSVVPSQELLLNQEANVLCLCGELELQNAFSEMIPFVANNYTDDLEDQLEKIFKSTLVSLLPYDKRKENETWKCL